jgi:hypothetical protein
MDEYLIWSHEHGMWWGPGGHGYTEHLDRAGHYLRKDAMRICCNAMPGVKGMLNELPVRLADVLEMTKDYQTRYGADTPQPWR